MKRDGRNLNKKKKLERQRTTHKKTKRNCTKRQVTYETKEINNQKNMSKTNIEKIKTKTRREQKQIRIKINHKI